VSAAPLLRIEELRVALSAPDGRRREIIHDVGFELAAGEGLALVGPSGAGKSLCARALLDLLPAGGLHDGRFWWEGEDMRAGLRPDWHRRRGRDIGLILQEPLAALDPVHTVGDQIAETVGWLRGFSGTAAWREAERLLAEVGLPDAARIARTHPHRLSGGMRQRALIAAALAGDPRLLVADEPTTALDVTVQRRILDLLVELRHRRGLALLLITHDLGVVRDLAEHAVVMDRGRVVERGRVEHLLNAPDHPVTRAMVEAYRVRQSARPLARGESVLRARDVTVHYRAPGRRPSPAAVAEVDLDLAPGRVLGLAGESGCGKTSLALALARLIPARTRELRLEGHDLRAARGRELRRLRRRIQVVYQDPHASLNPRRTVHATLSEALAVAGDTAPRLPDDRLAALVAEVGLDPAHLVRFPHELSGGQRQRVAIARSLAPRPAVLIADEPTSALDAPVRVRLLRHLLAIQEERQLALLLISHDLDLLKRFSDGVAVMLGGRLVEVCPLAGGGAFLHPYARELEAAAPRLPGAVTGDRGSMPPIRDSAPQPECAASHSSASERALATRRDGRSGEVASSCESDPASRCPYANRCALSEPACRESLPPLVEVAPGHLLRCPVIAPESA